MSEHKQQCAFFEWVRFMEKQHPPLRWMYAIPNGGARNKIVGAKIKREGGRKGVWDIHLPYPLSSDSGAFKAGLYIEFKWGKNRLTSDQKDFRAALEPLGYVFRVVYSADEGIKVVREYLSI